MRESPDGSQGSLTLLSIKQLFILRVQMCHRPRQLPLHCHYVTFELQGVGCFLGFFLLPVFVL